MRRLLAVLLIFILAACRADPPAPTRSAVPPTASPTATATSTMIPTATATPEPSATPMAIRIFIRVSTYWPPAGGDNCSAFVAGECVSRLASLKPWKDWIDRAVSCPAEWPFGTTVTVDGRTWVCLDRGGKIRYVKGIPWVDFLTQHPVAGYGMIKSAIIILPPEPGGFCPGEGTRPAGC